MQVHRVEGNERVGRQCDAYVIWKHCGILAQFVSDPELIIIVPARSFIAAIQCLGSHFRGFGTDYRMVNDERHVRRLLAGGLDRILRRA